MKIANDHKNPAFREQVRRNASGQVLKREARLFRVSAPADFLRGTLSHTTIKT